jgi:hypothetical protein
VVIRFDNKSFVLETGILSYIVEIIIVGYKIAVSSSGENVASCLCSIVGDREVRRICAWRIRPDSWVG